MSILILAEKPSVARDIARVIGASNEKVIDCLKYYEGNGYFVSNFRGHLVGLADVDYYFSELKKEEKNVSKNGQIFWNKVPLPILPSQFVMLPSKDTKAHVMALKKLIALPEVTVVVNGADAGREGECIFRYVYDYLKCQKPTKRLWISSLTDESIKQGMASLLDGHAKDKIYDAGLARVKTDWLIGMNFTRLYSMLNDVYPLNVGRVVTPTLRMIAERDIEISNFKKAKYYTLNLDNGAEYFVSDGENTFSEKSKADNITSRLNGKNVTVKSAEKKRKQEQRPLLHSLTSLQKEANEKHGLTAEQTLNSLQNLYEKKLTTYPRTDSNCITEDMKNKLPQLVKAVAFFDENRVNTLLLQGLNLDKRVVDNSKVSDHHAVIPTELASQSKLDELSDNEKKVFELVINRFLLALEQPYFYDETTFIFSCEDYDFRLISKLPVLLGWKKYEQLKIDEKSNIAYCQGDTFTAQVTVSEKETSPPKPFTESTLLSAMENISRRIEDKEKAEFVKERGLGTPATRASIIEKLVSGKTPFAERKGKNLVSTEHGRKVISLLPEPVKSIEFTADMEEKLSDIESGKITAAQFLTDIQNFIKERKSDFEKLQIKQSEKRSYTPQNREVIGVCPKCGKNVYESTSDKFKAFSCESEKCFVLWKKQFGKENAVTKTVAKQILTKKKSALINGFVSKTGKEYSAFLVLKDDFSVGLEFEKR
ncbi:DNA topoisomerase [Clostridia bacterium]|nr:DNA topoisomerase [Clostridia bacterium]